MNIIKYGLIEFDHADIISGNCFASHAMAGETLSADTLTFRVWSENIDYTDFVPGDGIEYYDGTKLINKFYLRG